MLDFFFALLRSGLYGAPVEPKDIPPTIDWAQVMALASKQTVMGLVFDAASRLPENAQPPESLKTKMLTFSVRVMNTHQLLDSALAEIISFYRNHGIECVLLKGQGIARCYRDPLLRQCGDIDLYIGKKNYARSVELALSHLASSDKGSSESKKHFHFQHGKAIVELHRVAAVMNTPGRSRRFDRWIESELEDASRYRKLDFAGTEVCAPSPDFDVFFIFYHAWYHFIYGGIGLRQLCDWTMALHRYKDEIDIPALQQRLRQLGLLKAWKIFGRIAVKQLGLPQEEMPLYSPSSSRKSADALKIVIEGGNFGHHNSETLPRGLENMPLLKRKALILRHALKEYRKTFPFIPMESTFFLGKMIVSGGVHTLWQLCFDRKAKDGDKH